MRQIKFRAWNPASKKYSTDYPLMMDMNGKLSANCDSWRAYTNECSKLILEQFTGLHDKNGKEIYEGDILKTDFGDICTVKFDMGFYFIETKEDYESVSLFEWCDEMSEIIGNIHENPDLLEAK